MDKIFFVGVGGFIGATIRYLVSIVTAKSINTIFPLGTFVVNVVGALLIGFIMSLSLKYTPISPNMKLFLTTGILGGLTTFSTFSYETISLIESGEYWHGIGNIFSNVILCLAAVLLGNYLAQVWSTR